MAKGDDIDKFAERREMVVLSIAELVDYRLRHDPAAKQDAAGKQTV
jgi:3,4-dihydroxy-2-butanone 4-phosphate synthase